MSRKRILDSAKALLWESGYESMSPRKVMDASGTGQGSLYHHFRTKALLADAALGEIVDELLAAADQQFAADREPLERIRAYLLHPRDGLKGCRVGRLANEQEVLAEPGLSAHLARYFRAIEAHLLQALSAAQTAGQLPNALSAAELATLLAASVQGGFALSRATADAQAVTRATHGAWAMLVALRPVD